MTNKSFEIGNKIIIEKTSKRIDLFEKFPIIKRIVKSRYFQFTLTFAGLFVFFLVILGGLIGTPIGNRNIAIVLIWIFWWFMLISILVPFFGRLWCAMCPLPFFGDFFQRFSFIKVRTGKTGYLRNKMYGLNKKWPKIFNNIWIPNFAFLTLCTFSAFLVTRPFVSAIVLGGMLLLATFLAFVYRLRAFCRHVCPVSGFIGLYSKASMIELRSKDAEICLKCKEKGCLRGNEKGWGCPWSEYMGTMDTSNYCGLCMECVKTCPNDNIALNLRPFASERNIKGFDESWKAFIDVGTSHAYSMIYLGASGTLKDWVNAAESGDWKGFLIYAGLLWLISIVIVPLIFYLLSLLIKKLSQVKTVSIKEIFLAYSYVLIPLGLMAWIAFSIPLILINGSYVISIFSDPFGWGWDLFGTSNFQWQPFIPDYIGYIQVGLLLIGLGYAINSGYFIGQNLFKSAKAAFRGLIPVAIFSTIIALAFILFFLS
ncbi:MAG: 4Fe-4S binding protein [Bacteroidia bacterium]|nr:4Fe-4S binding protein [Bacteroidia bacterium]